jgi:hypothetical protein
MALKPWYKVIAPREDLREGKPLDASEFAVHLDHVRDGRAPAVYQQPDQFFERTFLTANLKDLATQVVRRLSGVKVETSAVFNLSTQFGGGKTHALTLLYHLATHGAASKDWKGVRSIVENAGVPTVPKSDPAVFVGTEFDSITGRGGADGTPLRKTPWGEIAFQLGGVDAFRLVEEHEKAMTSPGGDVIEKMLPTDKPALILVDELMNYISRTRKSGLAGQLYTFVHNLSEVARSRNNVVLAVSIPASELEMNAEDQSDFERFKKLLDRLGKAMIMSAETETSEIIRRRLFEWSSLPSDAIPTVEEYESWFQANRSQIPDWFAVEHSREALKASYPFHPSVLSVFERKWQGLPRFQQTRGILRLLALWVSEAYLAGYKGDHKDPLISLGTAPLGDPLFRAAIFEQLGEQRLEGAVTTDIVGKEHAHALRLDAEATPVVKKARLHRKVATAIFFESNGGQQRGKDATQPEIRLAVAEPGLDIGHVEQCLEGLVEACYYLTAEKNRYRFSFTENLNKRFADVRATVSGPAIDDLARAEIQKAIGRVGGIEVIPFPKKSIEIPDRPVLTIVALPPENSAGESSTAALITSMTNESGTSSRTFKSALVWVVSQDAASIREEARRVLAWRDIEADADSSRLDEIQQRQLRENVKRAERDLREAAWRTYKNVFILTDDNSMRLIDLGLVHSSAANSLTELILSRLRQEDIVVDGVAPTRLTRYWPPALPEWSTKAVRDAFYASPRFPRLLKSEAVKDTISRGLDAHLIAYVGKGTGGRYEPFIYKRSLPAADVDISDDVFLITAERAETYLAEQATGDTSAAAPGVAPTGVGGSPSPPPSTPGGIPDDAPTTPGAKVIAGFTWSGEVPHQKWMNFYTKVLSRFSNSGGLRIRVSVDVTPPAGVSTGNLDETKNALRELGATEDLQVKKEQ